MVWKCRLAFGAIRRRRRSFSSPGATIRQCARPQSMRELSPFLQNPSKTRLFWSSSRKRKRCRPKSCSPFLGPARPRPEPPDKVTWLEARRVLLLYRERKKRGTSRVTLDVGNGNHQADQKLAGAGIRFHF